MTNKNEYPELNPNLQVTLTVLPDADRKAKLMGFAAYGVFKILEAEKQINLHYLSHLFDFHKLGDENTNVLLIIYALVFGHHKAFDVQGDEPEYFGDIILRAVNSGNSAYIHNYLSKRGYFESSYYKP